MPRPRRPLRALLVTPIAVAYILSACLVDVLACAVRHIAWFGRDAQRAVTQEWRGGWRAVGDVYAWNFAGRNREAERRAERHARFVGSLPREESRDE